MRPGITFDTGALIAATARRANVQRVLRFAQEDALTITVPAAVIAAWWREEDREARKLLRGLSVESLTTRIAQLAGEAIKAIPTATTIDAIVMASAAQRGDVVYTSDPDDLRLCALIFAPFRLSFASSRPAGATRVCSLDNA